MGGGCTANRDEAVSQFARAFFEHIGVLRGLGGDQAFEAHFACRADQLRCLGGCHARQNQQVRLGFEHGQQHGCEVGGVDLVGHVSRYDVQAQGLGSRRAAVTLA